MIRLAAILLLLALESCALAPSPATEARGRAAVQRYIAAKKHWRPSEYTIAKGSRSSEEIMYTVTFLADTRTQYPGGGESFWAYYDPRRDKIVDVLYGE